MDLAVRFEPARRFLSGEATLRMRLLLPASNLRLRLDDSLRVESVTSREGGRHLFFRVRGQNSLMVPLGPLTGDKGEIALTVRYSGVHEPTPVEQEVLQTGSGREPGRSQNLLLEGFLLYTNRTAWYPRPSLDDHATASLRFDLPVGLSAVTGGERLSARVEGQRTLVEYRQKQPAKYVTAAVGRFYEAGERQEDDLRLRAFGLPRTREDAAELLERSSRILRFFATQFGPCPYPDLNLVLVEGEAPGGHAPPGMVLLQRRPPLLRRPLRDDPASFPDEPDFFLAHELAHQWFGQAVSGANYRERWLSEGFAQYAAALWTKSARGESAFRNVLERFSRWALRYDAEGPIHLGYRVGHLRNDAQAYRAIVYDKAAYVLHMLRGIMGEEAFFRGLRAYQERHRYGKAGTDDLREALEAASGRDLTGYFRAWVLGNGVPRLEYRASESGAGDSYHLTLEVEASGLPGPVPVRVRVTRDGEPEIHDLRLAPGANRLTFDTKGRPRRIELNFDRGLLAEVEGS
jgi:aminopeptidase N